MGFRSRRRVVSLVPPSPRAAGPGWWLAALLLALPAPARAAVHTFARAGAWRAFSGTADNGQKVCGISAFFAGAERAFMIKYFAGDRDLVIQIEKRSWNVPEGSHVPVRLRFDQYGPWHAAAGGHGRFLDITVGRASLGAFMREFRLAYALTIRFPNGNENPWHADLTGTNLISGDFVACVSDLRQARGTGPDAPAPAPVPRRRPQAAPQAPTQLPASLPDQAGDASNFQ